MSFADQYLARHDITGKIESHPHPGLRFIVVIPCYDEPDLLVTLNSLWDCDRPDGPLEVIVVVNSPAIPGEEARKDKQEKLPENKQGSIKNCLLEARNKIQEKLPENQHSSIENSIPEARERNLQTISETRDWISQHQDQTFRTFIIHEPDLPSKYAGPGLARKIGMDEAVLRFNRLNKPDGVILSMDADCSVDKNYFTEIERQFTREPKTRACTIYFEHPVSGDEFPPGTYVAVAAYELHLRYYIQAIRNTGFPHAYHTVGSCFCVTAHTYVKQGGMNKRKGGEDFYFLQKTIPTGDFFEINSTCVYPSPRPSGRVPFGTGPVVRRYMETREEMTTYHPEAFHALREFFGGMDLFFGVYPDMLRQFINPASATDLKTHLMKDSEPLLLYLGSLPSHLISFLEGEFVEKISEINANSASIRTFRKRFYHWFNMFRILKYLNFVHENHFSKQPVSQAAAGLLREMGITEESGNLKLLEIYREMQRHPIPLVSTNG